MSVSDAGHLLEGGATAPSDAAQAFLRLTGILELLAVLGLATTAWLLVRRRRAGRLFDDPRAALALAAIVLVGVALRTLWADELVTPTHHAGLMSITSLYELSERPAADLLELWWRQLHSFQGLSLVWSSAVMMPVDLLLFALFGPSLGFPALAGAVWAALAMVLAFAIGRRLDGPGLGLAFAALLAVSPMQVTWSRVGGIYVGAVPHVLAAVWLGMVAVGRRSVVVALLAGAWSWMSLYSYYPARLALPLGAWTLVALDDPAVGWRRRALLMTAYGLPSVLGYLLLAPQDLLQTFWPMIGFRNFGESDARTVLFASLEGAGRRLVEAMRLLFVSGRDSPHTWSYGLGARYGGAILLPIILLGAVGLVRALRHPWRHRLVLGIFLAGLLPSIFSFAELRRLLVFDAAWCLLAAGGALALARRAARNAPRATRLAAACTYGVLACWSFGTVLALAAPPQREIIAMPFGHGLQSEGITCNGCGWRTRRWRDLARSGAAVVVVDGDTKRDALQFHLRADGYAMLASLCAGRPDAVVAFYDVVGNLRRRWTAGPTYHWQRDGWEDFLRQRLRNTARDRVVWVFTTPTQIERRAIAELERLGGRVERVHFPFDATNTLGPAHQEALGGWTVEVSTERALIDAAVAAVRDTLAPVAPGPSLRHATRVAHRALGSRPVGVAGVLDGDGQPMWGVAMPHALDLGSGHAPSAPWPAAVDVAAGGFLALGQNGATLEPSPERVVVRPPDPALTPVGTGCAALAAGVWLVVDPIRGVLRGGADTAWLPRLPWVGIASAGGRLALASATGELVIADPVRRAVTARWPMPIWRGRNREFGGCSAVLAGDGWYATYDYQSATAACVDDDGTPLGSLDLRLALGDPNAEIEAVGAAHGMIAVGSGGRRGWALDVIRPFPPSVETAHGE